MSDSPGTLPPIALVVAQYNASVTSRLRDAALEAYAEAGGDPASVTVVEAPGSFELPAIALAAARTGRFAGVVALGCIIQGETSHNRYIAEAVANGLIQVTLQTGVPATFGVLTVESAGQAYARAGGREGNKGAEAMRAALEAAAAMESLSAGQCVAGCVRPKPDKAAAPSGVVS
ncbi:MAG TPA: 6,7-dimethyl-8-ribityllumazine synthase [Phycisphaerales bacterium]|nr:6,7-dimethyl-8-ribityllumazine synthase [Phycisphaerales bacterium]